MNVQRYADQAAALAADYCDAAAEWLRMTAHRARILILTVVAALIRMRQEWHEQEAARHRALGPREDMTTMWLLTWVPVIDYPSWYRDGCCQLCQHNIGSVQMVTPFGLPALAIYVWGTADRQIKVCPKMAARIPIAGATRTTREQLHHEAQRNHEHFIKHQRDAIKVGDRQKWMLQQLKEGVPYRPLARAVVAQFRRPMRGAILEIQHLCQKNGITPEPGR